MINSEEIFRSKIFCIKVLWINWINLLSLRFREMKDVLFMPKVEYVMTRDHCPIQLEALEYCKPPSPSGFKA